MASEHNILRVVGRVTGRVRMRRMSEALVKAAQWPLVATLALFIVDKFVAVPHSVFLLPAAAFIALAAAYAAKRLKGVNRFEVAKIVDDQLNLKDRLTSALYFERLDDTSDLARAAIREAEEIASTLDVGRLQLGAWPRRAGLTAALAAVTVVVALGPVNIASWFKRSSSADQTTAARERREVDNASGAASTGIDNSLTKNESKKPITALERLETDRPPERDPNSMNTTMPDDVLRDIESIKASLDIKDIKGMQEEFKDEEGKPKDSSETKPPPIAPLDQGLLDDIARSEKTKSQKGEEGKDEGIGVAVKMPSKPGAKNQAMPKKGSGGHGGGDVGESGDTVGNARRVPIAGRDKLVIDSRKSNDNVEKSDLEKSVMNEVAMRLSMKDVEMTAKAANVPAKFTPSTREPVAAETVPPGLRGYIQRYFEGLAPRQAAAPTEE